MDLRADERGQPVQIGFVLVLAFLILGLALYQAVLVPQQNAEIEYAHFQAVQDDMVDLRNGALDAATNGEEQAVGITVGTTYPARLVAVNPAQPTGSLRTANAGPVELQNVSTSAGSLCNNSSASTIETRSVVFEPNYNEYGVARSVEFENTFVARSYRGGTRYGPDRFVTVGQSGEPNEIDLVVLTGSVQETGTGTMTIDLEPSRRHEQRFTDVGPTVVVPTRYGPSVWTDEILADESGIVDSVSWNNASGASRVEIAFTSGDYEISCAAVGLNEAPAYSPPPARGTDVPPTASIDGLADRTSPGGDTDAEFSVTWNVTDDRGLDAVSIELRDTAGDTVAQTSPAVSGSSASGTADLTAAGGSGEQYVLKVVVTDSSGQTDTESVTDVADGDSGGPP